ncbi:lipoprotein signal peptidase [Oceanicola sp. 22II-s10i]|uniref:signal peptidase II n=1 Tax=Oceanicola sp. 22II-s10i TaxID=1317116 RepID=UPI000B51FF35|nr:signal peptidase II [Oceanicola sp. 22II-s10i]OWU86270.1 lipoprotein signal peptidase [Oceanicola sp. 22II-s10i]
MRLVLKTALVIFVLDQVTKVLVVHLMNLKNRGEIDVFPPFVNFRMAWNQGINFGLFSGSADFMRWLLIVVAIVVSVMLLWWVHYGNTLPWSRKGKAVSRPGRLARYSVGLVVGGAIGNVIDRLLYGAVADFLNMSCCGIENPYAFNVADIAIFVGVVGLIFAPDEKKAG